MRIDVIWASIPVVVDAVAVAAAGVAAAVGDIAVVLADDDDGVLPLLLSFLSLPFTDEDCVFVVVVVVVVPLAAPPSANDNEITAAL